MARKRPRGSVNPPAFTSGLVRQQDFTLSDLLRSPLPSLPINDILGPVALTEHEDRRVWHPEPDAASTRRSRSRTGLAPRARRTRQSAPTFDMQALRFINPKFVMRCIRRKTRNEVLHALGKTGKGSGMKLKRRKYRRDEFSNVRC